MAVSTETVRMAKSRPRKDQSERSVLPYHIMICLIIWQSKSERSDWFFLGRDFAIRTVSAYFLLSKAGKFKTSMDRVPYNKLLTNLASSSRTGEYWPSVVFVRTSLRSVRTATTSGQYFPVRPSCSVSKRLIFCIVVLFSPLGHIT